MPNTRTLAAAAVAVAVIAGVGVGLTGGGPDYQVQLVVPSAAQLVDEAPVWVDGRPVGAVESTEVRDGQAIVTIGVEEPIAPLHDGTTSRIEWKSVLGERVVTLYPGPAENAEIPDGSLLAAKSAQVEVDTVLAAFDEPTRERLNSLIGQLNGTLEGREPDLQQVLQTAGPTVDALGSVLEAVGRDGRAIQQLITELQQVTGPLAERQGQVRNVVDDLGRLTGELAPQQAQLRDGLKELPATLETAQTTLDMIPAATDATVPLLEDLAPATERLPSVARSLSPLLRDLRPTLADLRPTLVAADELLGVTPGFLDTSHEMLPSLQTTMEEYQPALSFLRPYAPEIAGFVTTWGNAFSGYDSQGHVWAGIPAVVGGSSNDESLAGGLPAGIVDKPAPGALVDQPWTDANGDGLR